MFGANPNINFWWQIEQISKEPSNRVNIYMYYAIACSLDWQKKKQKKNSSYLREIDAEICVRVWKAAKDRAGRCPGADGCADD